MTAVSCSGFIASLFNSVMIRCLLVLVLALQTLTTSYVIPRSDDTWSEWSTCSLPCGGGVREQSRPCTQVNCTGEEYQYQSCNLQPCNNSFDLRQDQCSSITKIYPNLVNFPGSWSLEQPDTNTCRLSCINSQFRLNIDAPDGVPCKTLERQAGFCFGKMCLKSSCDGVLGSAKELDNCLNCPAYNSNNLVSCNYYSGAVELNQTEDAANGTLRSGATTISLTIRGEATLMECNNSQTVSEETQSFVIGGAEFTKQANGDLFATGPLVEDITIVLESLGGEIDLSVEYEYYLSEKRLPENGNKVYSWDYADFTGCSATCGRGLQVSHAHCRDEEFPNKAIPDWFCNGAEKPLPIVRICSQNACPPRWIAREWSVCTALCGQGQQIRDVSCRQVQSDGSIDKLPDSDCASLPKPNSTRPCLIRECGIWTVSEWGPCSEDCGMGERQREVYCVYQTTGETINDSNCEHLQRPVDVGPCNEGPCFYRWLVTAWGQCSADCGMGVQSRNVCCATQYNKCVNDTFCKDLEDMPPSEQGCINTNTCIREWRTTNWSECSGSCENAQEEREVECFVGIDGNFQPSSECDNMTRPDTIRHCIMSDCPTWVTGEWGPCSVTCGEGQMTRTVECQLNGQPATGCSEDMRPLDTELCMTSPCPVNCMDDPKVNCVSSVNNFGCSIDIIRQVCCFTCSNV